MEESSSGSSALQRSTHYCVACQKRVCSNTVQVHRFPNNESLREIWISTIRQRVENWQWSQNSRICGNHFLPVDYGTGKDTNKWRKRKSSAKQKLNKDAVPSVFTPFAPRPTKFAFAEARSILATERDIVADEQPSIPHEEDEKESDTFTNLEDLSSRISSINLPPTIIQINDGSSLSFVKLNLSGKPSVEYCVKVDACLAFRIWFNNEDVLISDVLRDKRSSTAKISSFTAPFISFWKIIFLFRSLLINQ